MAKKDPTFKDFVNKSYREQAQAFLNAFYDTHSAQGETIWKWCHLFEELDTDKKAEGCSLDEFGAHRFLQAISEPKTVKEFREIIKQADIDFDKRVALLEYLLFSNKKTITEFLAKKPPLEPATSSNPELMKAAVALNEVRSQINKIETQKDKLEKESEAGGIKGARAKNELQQLLSSDNTELNRSLLSAEAALRKVQKATGEKSSGEPVPGTMWWMNRELEEMKKYKPGYKGPK